MQVLSPNTQNQRIRLSATRIKTFASCNRKYYYKYVLNAAHQKNIYAVMGSSVHFGIAEGLLGNDPVVAYLNKWKEEITLHQIDQDVDLYMRGRSMVERYDYTAKPLFVEAEFVIPFPAEDPICDVIVVLDQVYDWGVKDLKTNKRKPSKLLLNNDLQFLIYAMAFEYIFNEKPKRMVWHHLETNEEIDVDFAGKETIVFESVVAILEGMEKQSYIRNIGLECTWCPFKAYCLEGAPILQTCSTEEKDVD